MPFTNPYQVQQDDKDLLMLAAKLGIPYQKLKDANPSITSISQGQYINVPSAFSFGGYDPLRPVKNAFSRVKDSLGRAASAIAGEVTSNQFGYGTNLAGWLYAANPNLPNPYGGIGDTRYGPPKPAGYGVASTGITGVPPRGYGPPQTNIVKQIYDPGTQSQFVRVAQLKLQLQGATSPSQMPPTIPNGDVSLAGYSPDQMLMAGYTLQGQNWVMTGAPGTTTSTTPGFQSANNWTTNPALHMVVMNRNARNPRNRFVTTEKWARNAYKRSRRGMSKEAKERLHPGNAVRADTPSTTLDLILGS